MNYQETIEALETAREALTLIGNLPMEFNGRARAIAQASVEAPPGGWKDHLSPEQIHKLITWQAPTKENILSTQTKVAVTPVGPATTTEEPLFPANPTTYQPPELEMVPVASSNIASVGHDGKETLRVQFKNSGAYDYVGITEDQFLALVNSESIGKAYNTLTRGAGIKGIKLQ